MQAQPGDFSQSALAVIGKLFFALLKITFVLLFLVVGALILAQSSVAPVSVRWLTSLVIKQSARTLEPVRPYFPAPYVVEIETHY